jgi:cell cycle protein kinase DBF2
MLRGTLSLGMDPSRAAVTFPNPLSRLIAHASVRYSTLDAVRTHPFFKVVPWDNLRGSPAPFVPALDSDEDTGYYDDFTSPEDMAKYAEVREKQRNVDRLREKDEPFTRGVWVGFTFGKNGPGLKALNAMADGGDDKSTLATIF